MLCLSLRFLVVNSLSCCKVKLVHHSELESVPSVPTVSLSWWFEGGPVQPEELAAVGSGQGLGGLSGGRVLAMRRNVERMLAAVVADGSAAACEVAEADGASAEFAAAAVHELFVELSRPAAAPRVLAVARRRLLSGVRADVVNADAAEGADAAGEEAVGWPAAWVAAVGAAAENLTAVLGSDPPAVAAFLAETFAGRFGDPVFAGPADRLCQ